MWIVNNTYFQYFSLLIALVSAVTMIAVSYLTEAPQYEKIKGLTFGTATEEDRRVTRQSWDWRDVAGLRLDLAVLSSGLTCTSEARARALRGLPAGTKESNHPLATRVLQTPGTYRVGTVFAIEALPHEQIGDKHISRTISAVGKKAGVMVNTEAWKYANARDLRRAFDNRWAKQVMPAVLQKLMRHSAIETTLRYYADFDDDD